MAELKEIIAKKLVELRKQNHLTQAELAEKLHYSDKAISKWEQGDSLPGIEVLYEITQLYEVPLDYLTHEGDYQPPKKKITNKEKSNRISIALLAISAVWCLATALYIYGYMLFDIYNWAIFIWALVPTCLIALIFNAIWGKRIYTFYIASILMWAALAGIYFQFLDYNLWATFILGAPMQISIILWARLK